MDTQIPQNADPVRKSLYLLIASILSFALIAGAWFYWWQQHKKASMQDLKTFTEQMNQADLAHRSGDLTTSINAYRTLAQEAPNKALEARVKSFLAVDLQKRGGGGDFAEALRLYASIVNDFTYPAMTRALAISDIASLNIASESVVRENLNQEPFISFLPGVGQSFDPQDFALRVHQYSDETYPNSDAKFNIAKILAVQITAGPVEQEKARGVSAQIQTYVTEAETLMRDIPYEPGNIAEQYLDRAVALRAAGKFLGTPTPEERKEAFLTAIGAAKESSDDPRSLTALGQTRLLYADFLNSNFPDDTQAVREQLDLLSQGPEGKQLQTQRYILSFAERNATYGQKMIARLSALSPVFKTYLETIGWPL